MSTRETVEAEYAREAELQNSMGKKTSRVKIEPGESWMVRFLPVELSKNGMWYMRRAQHWFRKQPVSCPHYTPEAYGGSKEFQCPLCDLSEELKDSGHDAVRQLGYDMRAVVKYTTWCIVQETEDARGRVTTFSGNDLLRPYEFDLYQDNFNQLVQWSKRSARKGGEGSHLGALDLETGNDVLASKGKKGTIFDKMDPMPIFEIDATYDDKIATIWKGIKEPKVIIPTDTEIDIIVSKAREHAAKLEEMPESDRRGRDRYEDIEPRSSSRRRSREGEDEDASEEDRRPSRRSEARETEPDPAPRRSVPSRREAPAQEEPAEETVAPRRMSAPPRRSAPPVESGEDGDLVPETSTPAPAPRRAVAPAPAAASKPLPPPARSVATTAPTPVPPKKTLAPPTAPRRVAPAPVVESSVEEDENVAEEATDLAPPAEESPEAVVEQELPPEVEAEAPQPKKINPAETKLSAGLRSKLAAVTTRGV